MKKFNYIQSAKKTFKIEADAIKNLSSQIDKNFTRLCELINHSEGKFIIMGVGKSGHIGQKISATLSSTGTGSIFLPALKRVSDKLISLTGSMKSTISNACDIPIVIKSKEACPLDLAPTSSTTSALAFGDALAIALLESKGFTKQDFASSHPAGKLGKKLITQVKHLMHKGKNIPKVTMNTNLSDALLEITAKSLGMTLVTNKNKVIGIFTDGDLRRCLNQKIDINKTLMKDVMTKEFKTIEDEALAIDAAEIMEKNKIFTLVVMNKNKNVGVLSMHDLIQARIL
jgi:arabinose-5-phosphate isomerase